MKPFRVLLVAAVGLVAGVVLALAATSAASNATGQTVTWCKDVAPGAQYESNAERYLSVFMGPGTGLDSPSQACASMDTGSATFVPSAAP